MGNGHNAGATIFSFSSLSGGVSPLENSKPICLYSVLGQSVLVYTRRKAYGTEYGFLKSVLWNVPSALPLGRTTPEMAWKNPSTLSHFHLEDRLSASCFESHVLYGQPAPSLGR